MEKKNRLTKKGAAEVAARTEGARQQMTVQSVKQSPMNAMRWMLTLSCGHETWVTSKSKPKRMKEFCPTCVVSFPR